MSHPARSALLALFAWSAIREGWPPGEGMFVWIVLRLLL